MELYATAFESVSRIEQLEGFASFYGADFYGLPRNTRQVTLCKQAWVIPNELHRGEIDVVPLDAGHTLTWQWVGKT
jgi:dihydroorotase